jgi:hypothetical protein
MQIKALIVATILILIFFIWLEKFFPQKKHNISFVRKLWQAMSSCFSRKKITTNEDQ